MVHDLDKAIMTQRNPENPEKPKATQSGSQNVKSVLRTASSRISEFTSDF